MATTLENLQAWFSSQCDGDWEHGDGSTIESLDNPGWQIRINLAETALEHEPFAALEDNDDHHLNWLRAWRNELSFQAA